MHARNTHTQRHTCMHASAHTHTHTRTQHTQRTHTRTQHTQSTHERTHTPYMSMMICDARTTKSHLQPLCLLAPSCLAAPQQHCLAAPRPLLLAQIVMNQRRRGLASAPGPSCQSRPCLASFHLAARFADSIALREPSLKSYFRWT